RNGITRALLVDALGGRDPFARGDPHDAPDDALDDVAPVRIHIEDQAAPASAIVPARALTRPVAAIEHPPAELKPKGDDAPEHTALDERGKLLQPRQVDLVLDRAVL